MAQVIITKDQIEKGGPCAPFHLESPEWDEEQQALVYKDWEATAKRLSATKEGLTQLAWLVGRNLVPMDRLELRKVRKDAKKVLAKAAVAEAKAAKKKASAKAASAEG